MSVVQAAKPSIAFDLRSAALSLLVVSLKTNDLGALASDLADRFGTAADTFDGDPVAIDLAQVSAAADPIDFGALSELLRRYRMTPVVARGGNAEQMAAARAAGLAVASAGGARAAPAEIAPDPAPVEPVAEPEPPAAPAPVTMFVDKPLRSGQRVYAKGGDLVVLAVVSFGAEVIADGNVHVYAPLRGRAIAGALGDTEARIFSACMEAQLISIAGLYRAGDGAVPSELRGKPAQVRLEGEKLIVEALKF
ncbi:MAG TPA: septum site-determining protein MinC [Burkholderiaceae bacterium]|nr:septum site-determining protein MinC [Burkholderiaceae bacterium]